MELMAALKKASPGRGRQWRESAAGNFKEQWFEINQQLCMQWEVYKHLSRTTTCIYTAEPVQWAMGAPPSCLPWDRAPFAMATLPEIRYRLSWVRMFSKEGIVMKQ